MQYQKKNSNRGRRTLVPAKELQCVINYAAFRLDRYGETSEKKLRVVLKNKTDNQAWIDQAIERMIDLGYLSDIRYAEMLVRKGVVSKGWGKRRIEQVLREKGIPNDVAEQALLALENDDPLSRAVGSLSKKFSSKIEYRDQKQYAKAVRHLGSRGYGFDVITDAIKQYNESLEYEEE